VYRISVVSVVLMLAVGQNAVLLCGGWCFPRQAASACQHQDPVTSARLSADDDCGETLGIAMAVRDDSRRSAPDLSVSTVQAREPAARAQSRHTRTTFSGRASPFHGALPVIALRI